MISSFTSLDALMPVLPEIVLAVGALALLMAGVFVKNETHSSLAGIIGMAIGLLGVVIIAVLVSPDGQPFSGEGMANAFIADGFGRYMKVLILASSALALILSMNSAAENGLAKFEYAVLVVLATLGMMIMVSASDLMSLYIGIELQSLALYVVAAIKRENARASEAGLKYFVLGALSSGMLLYGASMVYGFTGHTELPEIAKVLALGDHSIGLTVGLVFLLAGFAFKISAVPFHMWTPDVYEGAPTPVTGFFATAPKVAAMALLIRVVMTTFEPIAWEWQQIIIFLSVASMVLAAFAAIGQKSLKRLIAYSAIGHVGFALVGLSSGSQAGVDGVAIYLAIYVVMTVALFACLLALRTEDGFAENISDLAGLAQTKPFIAATMVVVMFSLIGVPPLAGFFAKWYVFLAAIKAQLFVLAVIGVLASAVSAFYYLRIVKVMYFDEPVLHFAATPGELRLVMGVATFLLVTYFFTVGAPLGVWAHAAAGSLF